MKLILLSKLRGGEMSNKISQLNPQMLLWAREYSGLSVEDIASKMKSDNFLKWETGEDFPTYPQLRNLFSIYKKPLAVAFFPVPPELEKLTTSFRTLPQNIKDGLSYKILNVINEARVLQLDLSELYNGLNPANPSLVDLHFSLKNTDDLAKTIRDFFKVPTEKQPQYRKSSQWFEFWRNILYDAGIFVFKSAFQDDKISGFSLFDKTFPVIYINNSLSFSRQNFTLFHELYHILNEVNGIDMIDDSFLDTYDNKTNADIEWKCNSFASEFLVPTSHFLNATKQKPVNESMIEEISNIYGVSKEVISRKLYDNEIITLDIYKQYTEQFKNDYIRFTNLNKKTTGGNYYATQSSYKGEKYISKAYSEYYQRNITIDQLSSYMKMTIPNTMKFAELKGWGSL